MAMLATPKSLGDVWELPVGAFNPGMRQFEQAQQFDAQTLGDMMSAEQYKQQERPLTLAGIAGQNRNRDAELPGIQARGRLAGVQADEALGQYDQKMESWAAENAGKAQKAHYENAMRAGPLLQQYGALAAHNPQSISRIREIMMKQGMGDLWNPQWDNADPKTVTAGLHDLGNTLTQLTPTMQKLMAGLDSKETIASDKNANALKLQEQRAALGRELARIRSSGSGKAVAKTTLPRLEQLLTKKYEEGDMESAAQIAETIRYVKGRDEVKPQISPDIAPGVFTPPVKQPNPLGAGPKLGTKENPIKLD